MPWWGWVVLGMGLLATELLVIDAQFYLIFLGISATIVGLLGLGVTTPAWIQWLAFAVLSVLTMLTLRRKLYALASSRSGHVEQRLTLGDRVTVPVDLAPGETCRVDYRGSTWTARNIDQSAIAAGKEAVIARIDGLTLRIKST